MCLRLSETESEDQRDEMLKKFERFQHLAELYHVYRSIQRYTVRTWYFVNPNLAKPDQTELGGRFEIMRQPVDWLSDWNRLALETVPTMWLDFCLGTNKFRLLL